MRFVLHDVGTLNEVAQFLRETELVPGLRARNVVVGVERREISFELNCDDDYAMRVVTNVFEGTGAHFSTPDLPGMEWTVA